jgi:hypothetical protein
MLVYNIGFWLPAAAVGKVFGWTAANAALFLWTWIGAALVGLVLARGRGGWAWIVLLILFGGLDALGTQFFSVGAYPRLWPPVSHLETWAGDLQYSSFTTQLFWVYNQAVPAWLCLALLFGDESFSSAPLLWSLCFFFAPLAAAGLAPFMLLELLRAHGRRPRELLGRLRFLLAPSNLAAAAIVGLSAAYFASNTAPECVHQTD